jgi:GDP-fucose transporter C1
MATPEAMYIASVVGTYWFVSIAMVYLNKILMSNEGISIPAPLFVTWFQCVVTVLICWLAGLCGQCARRSTASSSGQYAPVSTDDGEGGTTTTTANQPKPGFCGQFPKAEYLIGPAKQIFPLTLIFVGMITFNNLCLQLVEVSFYNVARSLTIVFNVILSRVFLGIESSTNTILCLGLVIVGFIMGSHGELNFSMIGTIAGVLSSLFVSLNSIFTKYVLPAVDDNHWKLTFYNNVNASFLFLPLIYIFEKDIIMAAATEQLVSAAFWSAMCVAGFFGFSIGIVTVLQIKATTPLSHNISGTAKAAVQSLMAFYLWGNQPTVMGVLGIFTVLGGSLLYTYVKMNENSHPVPSPPPPAREQEMSKV